METPEPVLVGENDKLDRLVRLPIDACVKA